MTAPTPPHLIADVTGHGEGTLIKVREALTHALGITGQQVTDTIAVMQNHGILFRERIESPDAADISDGYHTMHELYGHRRALSAVLATIGAVNGDAWRSKQHHPEDGPMYDGYFIVGIELPDGPISYHYPLAVWDNFAAVPELEHSPKWDGHDSDEVITRLMNFADHLHVAIREMREHSVAIAFVPDPRETPTEQVEVLQEQTIETSGMEPTGASAFEPNPQVPAGE